MTSWGNDTGPHLQRLKALFARIDGAYAEAAHAYGFSCEGCDQTCCGEHFLHHTLAEQLLLAEGLSTLDVPSRERVVGRSRDVVAFYLRISEGEEKGLVLCPLLSRGRCSLYHYRPLICRLHGLPYDLSPAGEAAVRGEGCHRFDSEIAAGRPHVPFDRTGYYREMAAIEIGLRRALGFGGRIRRTVAGMIAATGSGGPES